MAKNLVNAETLLNTNTHKLIQVEKLNVLTEVRQIPKLYECIETGS